MGNVVNIAIHMVYSYQNNYEKLIFFLHLRNITQKQNNLCGTNSIMWNIPHIQLNIRIFYIILSVLQNIALLLNNVMCFFHNIKVYLR